VESRNIKILGEQIKTVKNFSSNRGEKVQVTIALSARCRRGEIQEKKHVPSSAFPVALDPE
jgi:hypothetical protein